MTLPIFAIIVLILAMIISGLLVLKKSAKKLNLSAKELQRIKTRNLALDKEEQEEQEDKY
jgi:hypothetical protein